MQNYLKIIFDNSQEDIIIDGAGLTFVYNRFTGTTGNPEGVDQFQIFSPIIGTLAPTWATLRDVDPDNIQKVQVYQDNQLVYEFSGIGGITYSIQFWELSNTAAKDNIIFMLKQ